MTKIIFPNLLAVAMKLFFRKFVNSFLRVFFILSMIIMNMPDVISQDNLKPLDKTQTNNRSIRHTFKNGIDPTLFITRLELHNLYVDRSKGEGSSSNSTIARFDYTVSDKLRLSGALPYVYQDKNMEDNESGLGDSSLGLLVKPIDLDHSAVAGGFNFEFDTGDIHKETGRGTNIFSPILAASHELNAIPELLLVAYFAPKFSFSGGHGSKDVSELLMRFQVHRPFYEQYWWLLEQETVVDFGAGGDTEFIGAFEVGAMLKPELGLWLKPGIDLQGTRRESDWSMFVGIRYLFFDVAWK